MPRNSKKKETAAQDDTAPSVQVTDGTVHVGKVRGGGGQGHVVRKLMKQEKKSGPTLEVLTQRAAKAGLVATQ